MRIIIWAVAALVLISNTLSALWSLRAIYSAKSKRTKDSQMYKIYVTTINICDLTLGLYLFIICLTDNLAGEQFIEQDITWRKSILCYFAATISLFSLLLSALLLSMFSLGRFLVIKYPLNNLITGKSVTLTMIVSTISTVVLVSFALFGKLFLENRKQLSTPLCILLGHAGESESMIHKSTAGRISVILLTSMIVIFVLYGKLFQAQNESMKTVGSAAIRGTYLSVYISLVCLSNVVCWLPTGIFYFSSLLLDKYPPKLQFLITLIILPGNPLLNPLMFNLSDMKLLCWR